MVSMPSFSSNESRIRDESVNKDVFLSVNGYFPLQINAYSCYNTLGVTRLSRIPKQGD